MKFKQENQGKYQPLDIDFEITDNLQNAIQTFVHHINYDKGARSEDCYREEIYFFLKESKPMLSDDQYEMLKMYYVFGGIYDNVAENNLRSSIAKEKQNDAQIDEIQL